MTDQLSIYNQALLRIRESALAVGEVREASRVLDAFWDDVRREMLEAGFWKFAIRAVQISKDAAITPQFGLANAFTKPNDWVKTYQVSGSEFFDPPLDDWIEESNKFFADADPVYLRYVSSSSTGYGYDPSRWTSRFIKAFAFELAWRGAPKIAGASGDFMEKLEQDKKSALSQALSFEALREPTRRPPQGRWASSRFGRGTGRADGWRYA